MVEKTEAEKVKELRAYAQAEGHTLLLSKWADANYITVLNDCRGDVERAKGVMDHISGIRN